MNSQKNECIIIGFILTNGKGKINKLGAEITSIFSSLSWKNKEEVVSLCLKCNNV